MTLTAQAAKAKTGKWDYSKPESFCIAKEIIDSEKENLQNERIFANHLSDKTSMLKIYKNSYNSKNDNNNNNLIKKWQWI